MPTAVASAAASLLVDLTSDPTSAYDRLTSTRSARPRFHTPPLRLIGSDVCTLTREEYLRATTS